MSSIDCYGATSFKQKHYGNELMDYEESFYKMLVGYKRMRMSQDSWK